MSFLSLLLSFRPPTCQETTSLPLSSFRPRCRQRSGRLPFLSDLPSPQPAVGEEKQRALCFRQEHSSALPLRDEWPPQWGLLKSRVDQVDSSLGLATDRADQVHVSDTKGAEGLIETNSRVLKGLKCGESTRFPSCPLLSGPGEESVGHNLDLDRLQKWEELWLSQSLPRGPPQEVVRARLQRPLQNVLMFIWQSPPAAWGIMTRMGDKVEPPLLPEAAECCCTVGPPPACLSNTQGVLQHWCTSGCTWNNNMPFSCQEGWGVRGFFF